jgi:16S rRNA (cytosine967-C5)-methyltransferase
VEAYSAVQLEILLNASRLVRPGGRLVYATCSLDFAENTAVADAFERTHGPQKKRKKNC